MKYIINALYKEIILKVIKTSTKNLFWPIGHFEFTLRIKKNRASLSNLTGLKPKQNKIHSN